MVFSPLMGQYRPNDIGKGMIDILFDCVMVIYN